MGSPALRFLALGAVLIGGQTLISARSPVPPPSLRDSVIVVSVENLDLMRELYAKTLSGVADEAAMQYMIGRYVEDEMLYREALALGLDRGDDSVRWRLIEKMQYLGEATEEEPNDQVVERALKLGLERKDPVVRGALIQKYGMLVRFAHDANPPTEDYLRDFYRRHSDRYANPVRATFTHVFFSRQKRGERAHAEAEAALTRLRSGQVRETEAIELGDTFLSGHDLSDRNEQVLGHLFGDAFAADVSEAPLGVWDGPIASAFGEHLVFVSSRAGGGLLPLETVRSQVTQGVHDELREQRLRDKLDELRGRYTVQVEEG